MSGSFDFVIEDNRQYADDVVRNLSFVIAESIREFRKEFLDRMHCLEEPNIPSFMSSQDWVSKLVEMERGFRLLAEHGDEMYEDERVKESLEAFRKYFLWMWF